MSKNYCIFRKENRSSDKALIDAYNHNMRIYDVENADPTRTYLNKEPVDLNGKTYKEAAEEAIAQMRIAGAIKHKIRKDAVRGVEIILRYSHEADGTFDQDEWIAANVEWLRKTFNPPGQKVNVNGKEIEIDNLKSVIVHNDEGVPHIHAFIVPIDDKGHLNSNYYFRGRDKMVAMQNSYAEAMAPFGLERGEYNSVGTPQQVSRYLREIKKPAEAKLPPPKENETTKEYYERANTVFQNEKLRHRNEIVKQNQEHIRLRSEQMQRFNATHEKSWEIMKKLRKFARKLGLKDMDDEAVERIREIAKKNEELQSENSTLNEAIRNMPDDVQKQVLAEQQRIQAEKIREEEEKRRKEEEKRKKQEERRRERERQKQEEEKAREEQKKKEEAR